MPHEEKLPHTQGDHKGRPYYAAKRRARLVHSRGDGLSSPWGGVVALVATTTPHPLPPHYQLEEQTQSYNWQDNKHWAAAEKDYHQALE